MSPLSEVRKCSVAGSAAVGLLCGQFLGEGMSRKVFVCGLDSSLVVKVETEAGRFQNVKEWELWQEIQYTSAAKWLAPCLHLSPDGTILVMARTSPLALADYPDKLPVWLSDRKFANFGKYKGNFVCHDYGCNLAMTHGAARNRMSNVHWYGADEFENLAKENKA